MLWHSTRRNNIFSNMTLSEYDEFFKHYSSDGKITKCCSRYVSTEVEEFLKPVVYDFSPGSSTLVYNNISIWVICTVFKTETRRASQLCRDSRI